LGLCTEFATTVVVVQQEGDYRLRLCDRCVDYCRGFNAVEVLGPIQHDDDTPFDGEIRAYLEAKGE
jgi:hypothetical protein